MPPDPATLPILRYPDPALRRKAKPVEEVTPYVREVAARMIELMREAEGVGLAAPQVGFPWRLFVAEVSSAPPPDARSPDSDPPTATLGAVVYINPVLSLPVGPPEPYNEGCLSLPDITGEVLRPPVITLTAKDLDGNTIHSGAAGLLARCWQHEVDHLDGILIIDRMTQMSRLKNRAPLRGLEKQASRF